MSNVLRPHAKWFPPPFNDQLKRMQLMWIFARLKSEDSKNRKANLVILYTSHEGQSAGEPECGFVCIGWGRGKKHKKIKSVSAQCTNPSCSITYQQVSCSSLLLWGWRWLSKWMEWDSSSFLRLQLWSQCLWGGKVSLAAVLVCIVVKRKISQKIHHHQI